LVNFFDFEDLADNKNIAGDIIGFNWINDHFVKLEPYFEGFEPDDKEEK